MQEWKDDFNAFNTWKVLFHIQKLRLIAKGLFPSPVTVDVDLSNACNQDCIYCNSKVYRKETGFGTLPEEHLLRIANMLYDWGVESTCIGGGGEPTMSPSLSVFIEAVTDRGTEAGVITNGVRLNDRSIHTIADRCRFLGISIDSCNLRIYEKMRGRDHLNTVKGNVLSLSALKASTNSSLDLNAKVLIHPLNHKDLFDTARICKDLGFNGIQFRPVAIDNIRGSDNKDRFSMEQYLSVIEDQVSRIREIEDESFSVFVVTHKFADDLGRKISFKKCRATPLQAVFGADGWVYCCFNIRGYKEARICKHVPYPYQVIQEWGSARHKEVIDAIDPVNRCIRCTYNRYNEIIEKGILEDRMFYKFP